MSNFYYGATNNRKSLYHKGTKGMKWGYNEGKRNGKRTAGEGESYLDRLKKAPGDIDMFYEYNGTSYRYDDYEKYAGGEGRAKYVDPKDPKNILWVKKGDSLKDRKMGMPAGDTYITHIEEGTIKQAKRKIENWYNSLFSTHLVDSDGNTVYKKQGKISKTIEKGKKRVNKFLNKVKSVFKPKPKKAKITTSSIKYDKYN